MATPTQTRTTPTTRTETRTSTRTAYVEAEEPSDPSQNRHYAFIGALVLIGVAAAAVMAWAGLSGPGVLTVNSALFGLGLIALVFAFGLGYVLFTLRNNQSELALHRLEVRNLRNEVRASRSTSSGITSFSDRSPSRSVARDHAERVRGEPVIEIEGIGPIYSKKLNKDGIFYIGELCAGDADEIAPKIGTNATTVRQWQSMGELMQIDGIGKQYSELLVRCGIDSVETLVAAKPATLLAKIHKVEGSREVRIQGTAPITLERVKGWISSARALSVVTA